MNTRDTGIDHIIFPIQFLPLTWSVVTHKCPITHRGRGRKLMNMACSTVSCYRVQIPGLNNLTSLISSGKNMSWDRSISFCFLAFTHRWCHYFLPMLHECYITLINFKLHRDHTTIFSFWVSNFQGVLIFKLQGFQID